MMPPTAFTRLFTLERVGYRAHGWRSQVKQDRITHLETFNKSGLEASLHGDGRRLRFLSINMAAHQKVTLFGVCVLYLGYLHSLVPQAPSNQIEFQNLLTQTTAAPATPAAATPRPASLFSQSSNWFSGQTSVLFMISPSSRFTRHSGGMKSRGRVVGTRGSHRLLVWVQRKHICYTD